MTSKILVVYLKKNIKRYIIHNKLSDINKNNQINKSKSQFIAFKMMNYVYITQY